VSIVLSYLVGSVPFAYLVTRLFHRADIREVGTGNPGGANVLTHVGFLTGAIAGLLDVGKGVLCVGIGLRLGLSPLVLVLIAMAVTAGHCFSIYLGFMGGQGLSAAFGAMIPLIPIELGIAVLTAVIVGVLIRPLRNRGWFGSSLHVGALVGFIVLSIGAIVRQGSFVYQALPVLLGVIVLFRQIPVIGGSKIEAETD
jgi:glycerol-3-phosphate acyltransferase PlsY